MPIEVVKLISLTYKGFIADRKLVEICGVLELLETGDKTMDDKGFQSQDLLTPLGELTFQLTDACWRCFRD